MLSHLPEWQVRHLASKQGSECKCLWLPKTAAAQDPVANNMPTANVAC